MLLDDAISWAKERFAYAKMRRDYETAPPTNRKFDEGFVLLGRRDEDGVLHPIGAFLPELYVMAEARKLPCQKDNSGYARNEDGSLKTSFELAVIRSTSYKGIASKFKEIVGLDLEVVDGSVRRKGGNVPLPAPVFKYRIIDDYLPYLKNAEEAAKHYGLELYGTVKKAPIDDVKMNIRNPAGVTTTPERMTHYASQWMAWFLALNAGLETALAVGFAMPWAALPFAVGYLTYKCAKDFMLFDIAEALLRDAVWMFDKDYSLRGKISYRKLAETLVYLVGISYALHGSVTAAWASTLGLSAWSTMAALGAPALMVSGLSLLVAGSLAITAGLGTWLGLTYATRYFWTLTPFDQEIDPEVVKKAAVKLPYAETDPTEVIRKFDRKMTKVINNLSLELDDKMDYIKDFLAQNDNFLVSLNEKLGRVNTAMHPFGGASIVENEENLGAKDRGRKRKEH